MFIKKTHLESVTFNKWNRPTWKNIHCKTSTQWMNYVKLEPIKKYF